MPPTGPESKLLGGTNWPGAGFDVETGIFYSQAGMTNVTVGHYDEEEFHKVSPENKGNRTPRWEAEPNYGIRVERPAAAPGAPPAGGGINFPGGTGRRALAEGLEGLPIVKPPYGVLITKTLVVVGDPQFTAPAGRARGAMLRACGGNYTGEYISLALPQSEIRPAARQ